MYKKLSISFFSCELQMLHLYLFSFLANNDVCGERDSTGNFELIATPVGKCIYFLFVSFAKLSITGFVFTSPLGSYVFGCQAKSLLARLHKGI